MRGSWVAAGVGVVLGVIVCLAVLWCVRGVPEPAASPEETALQPSRSGVPAGKHRSVPGVLPAVRTGTGAGEYGPSGTGGVARRLVPRRGGGTAAAGWNHPATPSEGVGTEDDADEEPAVTEPPPTDYTRPATVTYWLEQARSQDAETRDDAFMHLKQCDAALAVPGLRTLLQEVEDPRGKVEILDTIRFLELPALPVGVLRLSPSTGQTTGAAPRPAAPVAHSGP